MDKFELLKQYKELLDEGIITQEDFDKKKKEILDTTFELDKIDKDVEIPKKNINADCKIKLNM